MTTTTQLMNINELFTQFLNEHGSADMVQAWQQDEYQEKLMALLPKKKSVAKTSVKDPNKPKGSKSAYIFFCGDHRAEVKKSMKDASQTDITRELGRRWNKLKESNVAKDKEQFAKYEEQARQDKDRHQREMEEYEPPSEEELEEAAQAKKRRKTSANKDPNKPKKGKTAYIFFCAEQRPDVKKTLGDVNQKEILAELGRRWNALKDSGLAEDKEKLHAYEKNAQEDKERYLREMTQYEGGEPEQTTKDELTPPPAKSSPKKSAGKVTGYQLFCKENREQTKQDHPELKGSEITKRLAELWKGLGEDQNEWKVRAADM